MGHSKFKLYHLQPVEPILLPKFSNFFTFILGANSYYPREEGDENGKMEFTQPEADKGISVPGSFKLDHLQPVKQILLPKFYNFFTFILGGQFLLPQSANNGKREFFQLQKWITQRGLSAWGIQTGPFAAF